MVADLFAVLGAVFVEELGLQGLAPGRLVRVAFLGFVGQELGDIFNLELGL